MIPAKVREEAAWLCQLAASNPGTSISVDGPEHVSRDAYTLAWIVYVEVVDKRLPRWLGLSWVKFESVVYAEAEALLRTGWEP